MFGESRVCIRCFGAAAGKGGVGIATSVTSCRKDDILDSLDALPGCGDHINVEEDDDNRGDSVNGLDTRDCPGSGGRSDG